MSLRRLPRWINSKRRSASQRRPELDELDTWLEFYLTGIEREASDALNRAERLVDLREDSRQRIPSSTRGHVVGVVDYFFANPIVTARTIETSSAWPDRQLCASSIA